MRPIRHIEDAIKLARRVTSPSDYRGGAMLFVLADFLVNRVRRDERRKAAVFEESLTILQKTLDVSRILYFVAAQHNYAVFLH